MKKNLIFGMIWLWASLLQAQENFPSGTLYGLKGGLTVGTQRWNNFDRQALFSYHGAFSLESAGEWRENKSRTLFGMQLGYHRRGSAVRVQYADPSNPQNVIRDVLPYPFHNLSLVVSGKGQHLLSPTMLGQYNLGLRLDYTVAYSNPFMDFDRFVNKFNYGLWLGGGLQWALGKAPLNLLLEVNISPDISRQIYVPPGIPIQYVDWSGNVQRFPSQEQKVMNMCFEVSVGLIFVKKREYYPEEEF
jgi:hypothetical protein